MDKQLDATRRQQKIWSETANALKARHEGARKLCFALSILAALLAAMASQLPGSNKLDPTNARLWLSIASAVLLSLVALSSLRFISGKNTVWVRARAASEVLKRSAWTYAAQAAPYDDLATRGEKLAADRQTIEKEVDDLLGEQVKLKDGQQNPSKPPDVLTAAAYTADRAEQQCIWYSKRADDHHTRATVLRWVEFGLAAIATALTAFIGIAGKSDIGDPPIDFIALTGVITTVSGTILAYIEASRLDFLVTSYRSAARQLGELIAAEPPAGATPAQWSAYVQQVENVLATENGAWMAKLGQRATSTG